VGLRPRAFLEHRIYDYDEFVDRMEARPAPAYERFPAVTPSWDNTARRQVDGVVLHGSTPERYGRWLASALASVRDRPSDRRLVFVNAWNEWAEGNHLEPDLRSGRAYLEATRRAVERA
jgi:lipopolysaccharide biosynthesis protein